MTGVLVLGRGRVGTALAQALSLAQVPTTGPLPVRDLPAGTVEAVRQAGLVVLAVPDDAIAATAQALAQRVAASVTAPVSAGPPARVPAPAPAPAIVHTSGAVSVATLAHWHGLGWRTGSWHPLQALPVVGSALRPAVTMAVTSDDSTLLDELAELTRRLAARPEVVADADKPRYHAAAALAANYPVTLAALAAQIFTDVGMSEPVAAVAALQRSAADGLAEAGLPQGLTGPLVRGDLGTVRAHLAALHGTAAEQPYRTLGLATMGLLAARGVDPDLIAAATALLAGPDPCDSHESRPGSGRESRPGSGRESRPGSWPAQGR